MLLSGYGPAILVIFVYPAFAYAETSLMRVYLYIIINVLIVARVKK